MNKQEEIKRLLSETKRSITNIEEAMRYKEPRFPNHNDMVERYIIDMINDHCPQFSDFIRSEHRAELEKLYNDAIETTGNFMSKIRRLQTLYNRSKEN